MIVHGHNKNIKIRDKGRVSFKFAFCLKRVCVCVPAAHTKMNQISSADDGMTHRAVQTKI